MGCEPAHVHGARFLCPGLGLPTGDVGLKVMVYLCVKHASELEPKLPMTDDVIICQVPVCFQLATWKYFTDIPVKHVPKNTGPDK
jgi:hypothetical protein